MKSVDTASSSRSVNQASSPQRTVDSSASKKIGGVTSAVLHLPGQNFLPFSGIVLLSTEFFFLFSDSQPPVLNQAPAPAPLPVLPSPFVFDPKLHVYQLQSGKCMSLRYKQQNRCHQCIAKSVGCTCSFEDIRSLTVLRSDPFGSILDNPGVFLPTDTVDETPIFPEEYNEPFNRGHVNRIKTVASHALLPTLQEELVHASRPDAIRIKQNLKVRSTCDACLHSILSGSFICQHCGKELCLACAEMMQQFEADTTGEEVVLKTASRTVNKIMRCTTGAKRNFIRGAPKSSGRIRCPFAHYFSCFVPYTRIDSSELSRLVNAMTLWSDEHPREKEGVEIDPQEYYDTELADTGGSDISGRCPNPAHPHMTVPLEIIDSATAHYSATFYESESGSDTTAEDFSSLWRRGEPIVVDVLEKYDLAWTPEWFTERFRDVPCTTVNNETGFEEATTVSEFFQEFGTNRNGESFKIKVRRYSNSAERIDILTLLILRRIGHRLPTSKQSSLISSKT